MSPDLALRAFADGGPDLPVEAIRWALAHWDIAGPRFLEKIAAYADGRDRRRDSEAALFFAIHCAAERRDTRLFAPLCRLLADPESDIEALFGDAIAETLPNVLIAVFAGDLAPLRALIERADADAYARAAGLEAFATCARAGALTDETLRAYWLKLERTAAPRKTSVFWTILAETAARLGFGDLRAHVAGMLEDGRIDGTWVGIEDFDAILEEARAAGGGLAAFESAGLAPFTDTIGTFEAWGADDEADAPEAGDGDLDPPAAAAPALNPYRGVGRNDPCPCGSGRKFKKCCGAPSGGA